jgi:hypothetical protein
MNQLVCGFLGVYFLVLGRLVVFVLAIVFCKGFWED